MLKLSRQLLRESSQTLAWFSQKLRNRLGLVKAGKLVFCYRMLWGKDEKDWWTLKLYGWTEV
jgi:hypothetical protein